MMDSLQMSAAETFIQLFMLSLRPGVFKWRVITALPLIFIQARSAVQVLLTHIRPSKPQRSRRLVFNLQIDSLWGPGAQ